MESIRPAVEGQVRHRLLDAWIVDVGEHHDRDPGVGPAEALRLKRRAKDYRIDTPGGVYSRYSRYTTLLTIGHITSK